MIVALGKTAMTILTGKKRLNNWRGSVLPCTLVDGLKVYPTFHPDDVNKLINEIGIVVLGEKKKQQQNILPVFLIDLKRIQEQAEFPEIRYPERTYEVDLTYTEIIDKLEELQAFEGYISVDIETLPGRDGPMLWYIGFSNHPSRAFTIPFLLRRKLAWGSWEEADILVETSKVFLSTTSQKIFQGGTYDLSVLGKAYGLRVADNTYDDTMWCHHASYPYIRKGLGNLVSIYTWEPYFKDEGKVHLGVRSGDIAEATYNCKDCATTREIFPITKRNARELGTWEGYKKVRERIPSLLAMMIRGVRVNVPQKKILSIEFNAKAKEAQAFVVAQTGKVYNLNSPVQIQELLYQRLGLPEQYNYKTKKPTTDKDALNKLKRSYPNEPILQSLLNFRKFGKLASTYADMPIAGDGRVRTSYSFISTWRLSSSESVFGSGGNLQNIPNSRLIEGTLIRSIFMADPNKEFVAADLSQAEARVVAWESKDLKTIDLFLNPAYDVHWEKAKGIFGFGAAQIYNPKEEIYSPVAKLSKPMKFFRNLGKTVVHAANYDMSYGMLMVIMAREEVFLPALTCKTLLEGYKQQTPMLGEWKRGVEDKIRATRTLISSYGRKRQFLGRLNDSLFRSAYAFSPQSTVGEIVEDGIKAINAEVPLCQIMLNNHDEVIVQSDPKDRLAVMKEVKRCMEIPLTIHGKELIIPVDFKVGPDWGRLEEVELCQE